MKYLFLAVLFSVSAMASEVSFKCDFTDETTVSQFSLDAKNVQIEDNKFFNTEFDFVLRLSGNHSKVQRLVVTRDGTAMNINAGINPRFKAMRLLSVEKGAEVEYISLIVGAAPLFSSQIRFLDGRTYFGTCKDI